MRNIFEQAIAESLRAVETCHEAMEDIDNLVVQLDRAALDHTDGQVGIQANGLVEQAEDEQVPGPVRIVAYRCKEPDRQREVCALYLTQTGYPIEVLSSGTAITCPDVKIFQNNLRELVRDPRFGLKLKALMRDAEGARKDYE